MNERTCQECGGPKDILHTRKECQQIKAAVGIEPVDRYHLAVIAAIIDRSPNAMAAAYKLYIDGFLKSPKMAA